MTRDTIRTRAEWLRAHVPVGATVTVDGIDGAVTAHDPGSVGDPGPMVEVAGEWYLADQCEAVRP